jgi:hypothetical protein
MQITVEIDLTNEQACRSKIADLTAMVNALYPQPMAQSEQVANVGAVSASGPASTALAYLSDTPDVSYSLEVLGEGARKVVSTILSLIKRNGQTTLEEVSAVTGDGLPTLRAHLANAGRSFKHANLREPYKAAWISEQHCVVYRAADANA